MENYSSLRNDPMEWNLSHGSDRDVDPDQLSGLYKMMLSDPDKLCNVPW